MSHNRRIFRYLGPVIILAVILGALGTASAISNGEPDNGRHPYVGLATDGKWACSGAAISPTVFVTAAHCFESPDVIVSFTETPPYDWHSGTWYPDQAFCIACGSGLPGFDSHDVAVIVFDDPVSLPEYASLPTPGLVDTLRMNTQVSLVGYGVQFDSGGGPRIPYDGSFTRYYAPTELVASNHVHADEFIKLRANGSKGSGGTCFGDSGGPDLLEGPGYGNDVILAVNSYVTNGNCAGVTYSNRIDTYALAFIASFLP
jgi:hypothetical protein